MNFHPLEAFDIPRGQLTLRLVRALPYHLTSGPGDTTQDIEEMAALIHELLSSDVPMNDLVYAIKAFSAAATDTFYLDDEKAEKLPPEQVIRVLREVDTILPDLHASYSEVQFTLPQLEKGILKYHHLLISSPRSDPRRPARLLRLGILRTVRNALSHQKSDLDNSIIHLNSAAAHGPVVIINQSKWRSDIIILHKYSPPSVISTPSSFHDRANRLKNQLLRARKESGLDSRDYDLTLASVLSDLYKLVGKPVIDKLRQLEVPENSRVW
ncbi:hypothetical protein EDB89DRAFT_808253 [Lactarius sanguifluus]|nr:hypothetical protein EDB89DRAFT_808253 [Lactarius sanguifluus]